MKKICCFQRFFAVFALLALCAAYALLIPFQGPVLASAEGGTETPASAPTETEGDTPAEGEGGGETIEGVRIPREIVLGIIGAAILGGGAAGYWIARRRK